MTYFPGYVFNRYVFAFSPDIVILPDLLIVLYLMGKLLYFDGFYVKLLAYLCGTALTSASRAFEGKKLLFTTKTCPNCVIAKRALEEAQIEYEVVDAQENKELVKKYGVMQAPTMVIVGEDSVEKYANASNITKYAQEHTAVKNV